jgi:AAA+ superfamily predicted ATPase
MQGRLVFSQNLKELILARTPLFYIGSIEIKRCVDELKNLASKLGLDMNVFTLSNSTLEGEGQKAVMDPIGILDTIMKRARHPRSQKQTLWVLPFFHLLLQVPDAMIVSRLRAIIEFNNFDETVILIGVPNFHLPPELDDMPTVEAPLPDQEEIDMALGSGYSREERQKVVRACLGLRMREVEDLLSRCLIRQGRIDFGTVEALKSEIVKKNAGHLIEIKFPGERLDDLGGLEPLKGWLKKREAGFLNPSLLLDMNLPLPRGILLTGVPGCGKSTVCKAIAGSWGLPLLNLDPSRIYSSSLGSSEKNLSRCLDLSSTASPCVLWVDEIEKSFSMSDPRTDGGVTGRLLGTFLHFLQERKGPVFVVATSNDIRSMPPEMLRKGRWDEIFFIDLSVKEERRLIFRGLLKRHLCDLEVDEGCLLLSEGFSGAEIEQAIVDARFQALCLGEDLTFFHIKRSLKESIPLSATMEDKIEGMRQWARGRAKPAGANQVRSEFRQKVSLLSPGEGKSL